MRQCTRIGVMDSEVIPMCQPASSYQSRGHENIILFWPEYAVVYVHKRNYSKSYKSVMSWKCYFIPCTSVSVLSLTADFLVKCLLASAHYNPSADTGTEYSGLEPMPQKMLKYVRKQKVAHSDSSIPKPTDRLCRSTHQILFS